MTDNLFDKYVKDKLRRHTSEVPDDMWERISPNVPHKRRGYYYWYLPLLLVVTLTGGYIAVSYQSREGSEQLAKDGVAGSHAIGLKHGQNKESATRINHNKDIEAASRVLPQNSPQDEETNTGNTETFITGSQAHSKASGLGISNKASTTKRRSFRNGGSDAFSTNNAISLTIEEALKSDHNESFSQVAKSSSPLSFAGEQTMKSLSIVELVLLQKKIFAAPGLNMANRNVKRLSCPTIDPRYYSNLYLEVYASPLFTYKQVESRNPKLISMKDSTESSMFSYAAGVRINKTFGNLVVKTGLEYSQINERFSITKHSETKIITTVTINSFGQADTTTTVHVGYQTKTSNNRYRSFAIPVILSYEFGNGGWRGAVSGGAVFNISSSYSGEVIDTSFNAIATAEKDGGYYRSGLQTSLYGSLSLIRRLSPVLDVFAEPYFQYRLDNMTGKGAPFSQKYHVGGVNLGVRFRLNPYRLP